MVSAGLEFDPLRVSTHAARPRDRVALWREEIGRSLLRVDIEPIEDAPFQAQGTLRAMPGLRTIACTTTPSRWRRTRTLIAGDDAGYIGMGISTGSLALVSQRGAEVKLRRGDAVVITHVEPASVTVGGHGSHLGLVVPLTPLAHLVADPEAMAGRFIPRENEVLRLLVHYLNFAREDLSLGEPELRSLIVTHIYDLIGMAIGATRDGAAVAARRGVRAARLKAIKADILESLGSHELSVTAVALRQGITPRYVHMLFETEGISFSQYVLQQRLAGAHRMLTDPNRARRTITEIAYASGFGDISYFNRVFRRRYGASPSEVRASVSRRRGP